jgi:hypothetical protein
MRRRPRVIPHRTPHQRAAPSETRWAAVLAAATLAFVLAVIGASAYIRLGGAQVPAASIDSIDAARTVRKSAGAVAALGVVGLAIAASAVRATRPALGAVAGGALAMTVMLSLVGVATGVEPPRAAAFANQFGGAALAGLLGWLSGRAAARLDAPAADRALGTAALVFCVLQAAFGGAIATLLRDPPAVLLIVHAATGMATACCVAGLVLGPGLRDAHWLAALLALCAVSVPLIGVVSTLVGPAAPLQVAHTLGGATLLACAAHAAGRFANCA